MVLAWPKDLAVEHLTQHCTFLFALYYPLPSDLPQAQAFIQPGAVRWEVPVDGPYNPLHWVGSAVQGWAILSLSSRFNILHLAATKPPQLQLPRTQWCVAPSVTVGAISTQVYPLRRKFLSVSSLPTPLSLPCCLPSSALLYFNRSKSKINKY